MGDYLNSDQRNAIEGCAEDGHDFGDRSCMGCGWPANSIEKSRRKTIVNQAAEIKELKELLKAVNNVTYSHVDGRDLLAELHPRHTLDIKRRVDAVESWFEGDWLSNLFNVIKDIREKLDS